ncbi:ABC transporter substrate-binding protein [Kibdelosporangium phytohabitans]|uniref:LacI family transcriptional regulator n=1 Tax=Kibdelosporangium phytohabitans TaxID=860235 RepID=A0A0N7F3V0_9PSEU|nr:ABC transporter substrate-binding protein [Kibdelosporangium phytohabitans]ALG09647.1 LacI family transcriptional regulator [Kibdelosporangium phytohabitans]MBE1469010.1 ribose transport system substrate-binding protein [Kibdelosporangium phytohabitans]
MAAATQSRPVHLGRILGASLCGVALVLSGCAKSEEPAAQAPQGTGGAQAPVAPAANGPTCTLSQYGGTQLDLKNAIVGFSQSEKEANPFRIAETQSIKDEAAKAGVKQLLTTNANSQLSKQISDIQDMINKGAQALIIAPLNSDGLEPALSAARTKNIPVLTIDRKVNSTTCKDYVSFLGSNFVEQGKRAAKEMAKALGNKGKVAILLGASGNNVTTDRTAGFVDELKASAPDIQVVAQQTGDFARDKGQQVMEQIIQAQQDINGVYAENDEMGLGALVALRSAGKKPGTDIHVVSIDGTRNAVQKVVDGEMSAVVESNPRFGPLAFQTLRSFLSGQPVQQNVVISDKLYGKDNAAAELGNAY